MEKYIGTYRYPMVPRNRSWRSLLSWFDVFFNALQSRKLPTTLVVAGSMIVHPHIQLPVMVHICIPLFNGWISNVVPDKKESFFCFSVCCVLSVGLLCNHQFWWSKPLMIELNWAAVCNWTNPYLPNIISHVSKIQSITKEVCLENKVPMFYHHFPH